MGSSQSTQSGGSGWTSKIFFDPQADSPTIDGHYFEHTDLQTKLAELIDINENIEHIWVCSHPLFEWQLCQGLHFYHTFVVIETKSYYWSIEKNTEGITIQRSRSFDAVLYKLRRESRIAPLEVLVDDIGRMRMKDLIDWLYELGELNKGYFFRLPEYNCQGFARRIFDNFALTEICNNCHV